MTPEEYQKASNLFLEVLDLPEVERKARLDEACGPKTPLRIEVEDLLRAHEETPQAVPSIPTPTPQSRGLRFSKILKILVPLAALVLASFALLAWALSATEKRLVEDRAAALRNGLDRRVQTIQDWAERQKAYAGRLADDPWVSSRVVAILRAAEASPDSNAGILSAPDYAPLIDRLMSGPPELGGRGVGVLSAAGRIVGGDPALSHLVGGQVAPSAGKYLRQMLIGQRVMTRPYHKLAYTAGLEAGLPAEPPVMYVGSPVRDDAGRIIAAVCLRFEAESSFGRLFPPPGVGRRSECFAFDELGLLLTEPSDAARLRSWGLVRGPPGARAALHVTLSDPGGDLEAGHVPSQDPTAHPLTELVRSAPSGVARPDTRPYRNLRGRNVIGVATWLPEWEMGVALEADLEEILAPARPLRLLGAGLIGLLAVGAATALAAASRFRLVPRDVPGASFGAYRLERRIGKGGAAEVFLARHVMLKRPTAVKVLSGDGTDPDAVARFEREARLMSGLSHPNTVQLYDYGRTPDGHLYLAMEYLDGLNLSQLVSLAGPLPAARAVHLLTQICGSLAEAHAAGLVHRDLKPGNVMVCRRAGLADLAKVLDFGIARAVGDATRELTRSGGLTGTPLYIAPERIQNPQNSDPRSDLYSLGALAYLLLAGRAVFEGSGPAEVLMQSLSAVPPEPSRIRGTPLPADLERLVLDLLAKEPSGRPASAAEVERRLRAVATPDRWDAEAAEAWWNEHEGRGRALIRAAAE